MTRRIKRKLNSDAGVTVILALLGFLIAAMASFTIVTVSLNNVSRVDDQQREQRDYLALTSAVALLRDSLAGQSVTISETIYEASVAGPYYTPSEGLAAMLVKSIYESGATGELGTLSINPGDGFEPVQAVISYSAGGTLNVTLQFEDTEKRGATAPLTVSFSAMVPVVTRDEVYYRTDTEGNVWFDREEKEQVYTFHADTYRVSAGNGRG